MNCTKEDCIDALKRLDFEYKQITKIVPELRTKECEARYELESVSRLLKIREQRLEQIKIEARSWEERQKRLTQTSK